MVDSTERPDSYEPGRLRTVMAWMRETSSAVAGALPLVYSAISRRISAIASVVLSICTGALAVHRRGPSELVAPLRAP